MVTCAFADLKRRVGLFTALGQRNETLCRWLPHNTITSIDWKPRTETEKSNAAGVCDALGRPDAATGADAVNLKALQGGYFIIFEGDVVKWTHQ